MLFHNIQFVQFFLKIVVITFIFITKRKKNHWNRWESKFILYFQPIIQQLFRLFIGYIFYFGFNPSFSYLFLFIYNTDTDRKKNNNFFKIIRINQGIFLHKFDNGKSMQVRPLLYIKGFNIIFLLIIQRSKIKDIIVKYTEYL